MMEEEKDRGNRICPYLGQISDPRTAFSYPSDLNCCLHAKPVAAIDIGHQEQFCLTSGYPNCEEYKKQPGAHLPAGLHASHGRRLHKNRGNYRWVWGVILIILAIIVAWLLITRRGSTSQFSSTPTLMIEATGTSTELTPTVSPINALTHVPTFEYTATTRPSLGLETPLGINHEFMIHQIQDGESLDLIASEHGTSVATLLACNYRLPAPLLTGWKIVVPLVNIDTQGLPAFEVYNVTEEISLKDLANQLSVDLKEFEHYNAFGDDFIPRVGDWLLVPRSVPPTHNSSLILTPTSTP